jgi:hypothetical protein
VEDVGVAVDDRFRPASVEDVILGFPSLIRRACEFLGSLPTFRIEVVKTAVLRNGSVAVELETRNVNSLQFFLDGHLALTADAGGLPFTVPALTGRSSPSVLRIKGYREAAAEIGTDTLPAAVRTASLEGPRPATDADNFDPVTQSPTDDSTGQP